MSDAAGIGDTDAALRSLRSRSFIRSLFLFCLLSLVFVPGCGGCSSGPSKTPEQLAEEEAKRKEEEAQKKKLEKKLDFVFGRPTLQPGTRGLPSIYIKPGHWASATQSAKANNFDFLGEMDAAIVDAHGDPIDLDRTPFRISTARPAALVKGQEKYLDMTVFVPHAMRRARLSNSLRGSYAGSNVNREESLFQAMPPYQYFMLVVARIPERYGFLNPKRNVITFPWSDATRIQEDVQQYQVISTTSQKKPILLPSDAFTWTSTAYMFWDDVEPNALLPEQQQALLDWVHWGGQLIISGPGSLASLKGSFLSPYLPATARGPREYTTADLAELNEIWTLPLKGKPGYPLRAAKPWSGVELDLHASGQLIPNCAGLLAERRVGLGRIAVSAIHLSQPELTQWIPSFDGFLNGCVLRRGPRKWERGMQAPRLAWAEGDNRPDDPTRITGVRYFSRDAGSTLDYHILKTNAEIPPQDHSPHHFGFTPGLNIDLHEEEIETTSETLAMGGVASWNPFSPLSDAARESLRQAAGVSIPKAWFVLWVVGLYILLIVPVNWLVFTVIGRLEWAWIAAPILAIAFSVLVVRLAQLDIGFVRSQTEVAVLELQPNYQRGHLTRYVALYTSLGTEYDFHFETPEAVAQPLPLSTEFQLRPGQSFTTVNYRRFEEVTLNNVTVSSNSTGMLQSEQMVKADPISIHRNADGSWIVRNGTEYDLEEACVSRNLDKLAGYHFQSTSLSPDSVSSEKRRTKKLLEELHELEDNELQNFASGESIENDSKKDFAKPAKRAFTEFAWVGELKAGQSKTVYFEKSVNAGDIADKRAKMTPTATNESLKFDHLFAIAEESGTLAPGETRLVGKINTVLPGARVTPEASQFRGATLVVAHLHYEHLQAPQPDLNTASDIPQSIEESQFPLDEILAPPAP